MSKHRFSLVLIAILEIFYTSTVSAMDDDLMLDMGLDTEQSAPAPQATNKPLTTLPAPTSAPKVTPPPSSKKIAAKKKNIATGIDLITRIKSGMDFNTEEIENWVMAGNDINLCMENGKTLLMYLTTKHTDIEAVRFLIDNGAELQTHCTPRYEILFETVKENKYAPMVETLIDNNANIVATDEDGNTALILTAAYNKNPSIINTLLEYGVKINATNKFGQDALTLAIYNNAGIPMIQTLLDNGADVNATDNQGHTPLMAAAVLGNDMTMQYLIKRGADFNATDNKGVSVLDYYTKRTYLKSLPFQENQYDSLAEKLEQTYKFIAENHLKYNNALQQSLYTDNVEEAVSEALKHNADVDILDSQGCTQLINAIKNGHTINIIEKFINAKANTNATCEEGKTPLMFIFNATNQSTPLTEQIEKIRLLTDNGAKPDIQDANGNTALIYASANNAAPGTIEALLNAGANINISNNAGTTALMAALKNNAPEKSVTLLLENDANPNITDNSGQSPLWYLLTANGNPALVQTLLEYGANVETPDASGTSPLWYSLTHPLNEASIVHIITAVSNTNTPNTDGDTPLLHALKNNLSPNIIQALLTNGADPKLQDRNGQNAYDILKKSRFFNEAMKIHTREKVLNKN